MEVVGPLGTPLGLAQRNPMPAHHFEGNPVDESTSRRGNVNTYDVPSSVLSTVIRIVNNSLHPKFLLSRSLPVERETI